MDRFSGTCEYLAPASSRAMAGWIETVPFEEWPQQHRLEDGKVRPSMVTDLSWNDFGKYADPVVLELLERFPGCRAFQQMLSVVMPGHSIPPHTDSQASYWVCRVHVPLTSNPLSKFMVGGVDHVLEPGKAYRVNTEAIHGVVNDGPTPRIHFMFDVKNQ
jgi:hypothetical protein